MNWPFKFFDSFSWTGKSKTREVKQKVRHNTGKVQQAGRDIYNHPKRQPKSYPLLFIRGLGWGSNQEGVSLMPEFLNGSDEVLFIKSIKILGEPIEFERSIAARQSDNPHLPTRPLPESDSAEAILVFYKDAGNNHYCSRHSVSLEQRADGRFNFKTDIRFKAPVKKVRNSTKGT